MFKPEMLRHAGPDLRTWKGFQALFILEPHYRHLRSFESKLSSNMTSLEYVSYLISMMVEEYQQKYQGYKTTLTSRFMELVVYLSRQYGHQETDVQSHLMHLANAISYIEDHYLETITRLCQSITFNDSGWSVPVHCWNIPLFPLQRSLINAGSMTATISLVNLEKTYGLSLKSYRKN